uniref:Uncharacterized protein n=1 Tax=Spongospora subterranea TaxID=70186 RepID=A0A0H5RFX9_9EUKA|eukprot:CRZ12928.1 hypothetical protein [Spongospora subterranea]
MTVRSQNDDVFPGLVSPDFYLGIMFFGAAAIAAVGRMKVKTRIFLADNDSELSPRFYARASSSTNKCTTSLVQVCLLGLRGIVKLACSADDKDVVDITVV